MDAEEKVRALCARAATTDDPDELDEILAQFRALLRAHFEKMGAMIEQRRRHAELQHVLDRTNKAA